MNKHVEGNYTQMCIYLELLFIYIPSYLKVKIIKLFPVLLWEKNSQVNQAMKEIYFQCLLEIQQVMSPIFETCVPK